CVPQTERDDIPVVESPRVECRPSIFLRYLRQLDVKSVMMSAGVENDISVLANCIGIGRGQTRNIRAKQRVEGRQVNVHLGQFILRVASEPEGAEQSFALHDFSGIGALFGQLVDKRAQVIEGGGVAFAVTEEMLVDD